MVQKSSMHILHLSDTHNCHRQLNNLPMADIIVHTGDITMEGTCKEIADFMEWFVSLNYRYKIFIAGNHDFGLKDNTLNLGKSVLPENCFFLYHSGVEIEGIKFWGIPFFFSDEKNPNYPELMRMVPMDTDILVTHRPPMGILDVSNNTVYGCSYLLQTVLTVCPRYHLFGHIHNAYGIEKSKFTIFANASMVDDQYHLINKPFVFNL